MLKLEAPTGTLFAEHIDQDPLFFFFLVTSSSVCWKEKGTHLDRSSICILIIAQLRSWEAGVQMWFQAPFSAMPTTT